MTVMNSHIKELAQRNKQISQNKEIPNICAKEEQTARSRYFDETIVLLERRYK